LLSKHKALGSIPITTKRKNKGKRLHDFIYTKILHASKISKEKNYKRKYTKNAITGCIRLLEL
jgi:hypothetical protein